MFLREDDVSSLASLLIAIILSIAFLLFLNWDSICKLLIIYFLSDLLLYL